MSNKIRIAIAGVGGCASSLIQGVQWYIENPQETVGLTYEDIGGYTAKDLIFVTAFDVDKRKVGKYLGDAIFQPPINVFRAVQNVKDVVDIDARVLRGPTLDGIPDHMRNLPEEITFVESDVPEITADDYIKELKDKKVDILLNYVPVGADKAAEFYIENAIKAGVHIVNCMPTYISTDAAKKLEQKAIDNGVTIIGSDMRSQFGASRLSEILQGGMLDSGLHVTQHIQMNMAAGSTQGQEHVRMGRSANTDFVNMAVHSRLKSKHISKENVLMGQNVVRDQSTAGATMYAGPSLTVFQKPGGQYIPSDNKIANLDIVAFGWSGARYELTARMSVQDSPNSGGIVFDAIRFCRVAQELGVVGYLRGPSSWTQKTPPVQMKTADSKFECDALARRIITPSLEKQLKKNNPKVENLEYTFQKNVTDYEA